MDYEKAVKTTQPSLQIKDVPFQKYINPLLGKKPPPEMHRYFLNQGYLAWRLSIKKSDISNLKFIEWLCEQLLKSCESDLIEILSSILDKQHDTTVILNESERNYYQASDTKLETRVSNTLRHYKVFFENLKIWGTIPHL